MLAAYLKTIIRTIKKHKGYSLINIAGLSIGIALFLLIMLFVQNESGYDGFNENLDRIYRIELGAGCVMSTGIAHILEGQIPEIEKIVRFYPSYGEDYLIKYEENFIKIPNFVFADSSVFEIFSFPLTAGDSEIVLKNPFSLVLTESTAKRIFGTKNPVGQTILVDNKWNFRITGIISDVEKSHIPIDAIASFSSLIDILEVQDFSQLDDDYAYPTYVLLPKEHDLSAVTQKIDAWLNEQHDFEDDRGFSLRPLKGLYFLNEKLLGDQYRKHGNRQFIRIFIFIGTFILVIAGINFINLATSRASNRAKEVGMKKVVGASRKQLVGQFLLESVLTTGLALIFGFIIAEILLPVFNSILSGRLTILSFLKFPFPLLFLGGAVVLGIITGLYPALYLSAFVPNVILKGMLTRGRNEAVFRRILIVFQFSVSIILIIAFLSVFKQMNFMKNANLGFDKDHILVLDNNRNIQQKKDVLRTELMRHPNISNVSFSCRVPGETMWTWTPKINGKKATVSVNAVDPDFFRTYGVEMSEGRDFSWTIVSDKNNKFIVNEAALRFFEMDSPLDQKVEEVPNGTGTGKIIGVVKDFHFNSLHTGIDPVIFYWLDWPHRKASVKISFANRTPSMAGMKSTMSYIKEKWEELCPDFPFEYAFLDESFDRQYKSEEKLSDIFMGFAFLAIFIACLGLFALASFTAEKRTKEIGVRKILGASSFQIVFLLGKEFTKWVLVANLIAWPVAFFAMNRWLGNFAYRTDLGFGIFILSSVGTLFVALFTVSFQAIRAAVTNPVDSLRFE
ncbi:MAG: ABC transporter permease [Candidatus Aminicenantes bacterium]|nr:ABC transporter permease [Candidatus Aminicenantes bacterium]